MPIRKYGENMNKARVAEAVRGTYPIWNCFGRKPKLVDMTRESYER